MESLDAFADEEAVSAIGTDEIIETWYDYMDDDRLGFYNEPVFSAEELNALRRFHNLLECSWQNVPTTWRPDELEGCTAWSGLVAAAREERAIFLQRGRSDEERENT
ncbi:hypothetical protein SAMN05216210_2105 [Halopseudomonas salegens]|uniref:Uncharacterized protein n=2 Tax=Halopseudomonas salegens TaxID=1434072 RepID=A0A1H2G7U3_9GAMM|nr:hypothetical protein SAMN05216210_2105 [Halopseudomonas salegens]